MMDKQQLQREKLLLNYLDAFEQGDLERLSAILHIAERDPQLNRMIQEIHNELDAEISIPSTISSKQYRQNGSHHMTTQTHAYPAPHQIVPVPHQTRSLTLVATLALLAVISALMLTAYLNRDTEINLLASTAQSQEQTRLEIFQRYIDEVWNETNTAVLQELVKSSHICIEAGNTDGPMIGSPALVSRIMELHRISPDLRFTVDEMVESGDKVWAILTLAASSVNFQDEFTMEPQFGDQFVFSATMIVTFQDDLISETWLDLNITSLMWEMMPYLGVDVFSLVEQRNITAAQRIFDEVWNNPEPDVEVVRELFFRTFKLHDPWWGEVTDTGPGEYWRTDIMPLRRMMPDLRFTAHSISAEGDKVSVHYTAIGTWENALCPDAINCPHEETIPPSLEPVTWNGVFIYRFENGLVVEEWGYMDPGLMFTIFEQAGGEFVWPETRSE